VASPIGGFLNTHQEGSSSGVFTGTLSATPSPSSLIIGAVTANGAGATSPSTVTLGNNWSEQARLRVSVGTIYVTFCGEEKSSTSVSLDNIENNFTRLMAAIEVKSATPGLYQQVDEVVASDVDFIRSPPGPLNEATKFALGNPTGTPGEPFTVRYRAQKDRDTGTMELRVRLLQGLTQIASWTEASVPAEPTNYSHTLSGGEFAAITDFNDLFLEFRANYT
jgi:hypothetical protein